MSSWLGRDYKLIVNNIPISEYNAMLQQDYSVSGAEISSSYADNGRSLVLLGQKIGLKTLTVKLTFFGKTSDESVHAVFYVLCKLAGRSGADYAG